MNSNTIHHSRSKSSPIKLHSFVSRFNEHLYRVISSAEDVSMSKRSLSYKLNGLINLLSFVDSVCRLTCCQQQGVRKDQQNSKLVDSLLDESLWLIDVCDTVRDVLMQTIEETQQLQSVLRRKAVVQGQVSKEFDSYLKSRKRIKKVIIKLLKEAGNFRNKVNLDSSNENQKTVSYLHVLERSHLISVDVLKSLLVYIACSRTPSKWSLISKLVNSKQEQSEEKDCLKKTKFEVVDDDVLHMAACHKKVTSMNNLQIEYMRRHLEELELVAVDLERAIGCLSRLLIKSRVVLLNLLHQHKKACISRPD